MLFTMARSVNILPENVGDQPDAIQPLPHEGTGTSTSPRRESSMRERKRHQNRIAQRNYRRNQKQKLQALEAVVGQSTGAVVSSSTTTCTCSAGDSAPRDLSSEDQMWAFDPLFNDSSPPSVVPTLARPALHRAVCNGNEAIVRLLLERGADVIKQDSYGQTALHLAVENGFEGLVQVLLEKVADPNLTDSLGRTALFSAVQNENEMVAKLLLDASIDVNWRDSLGVVALHLAAERGSEVLTTLLLAYGANIDA